MVWEWQVWRCFDNIRETFEEKGWEYRFTGGDDNEVMPLLAESGDCCVAFFKRDPGTGECWFELRDKARLRVLFVQGTDSIPGPERAAILLEDYGYPSNEITNPMDHPVYELPVAPLPHMEPVKKAG